MTIPRICVAGLSGGSGKTMVSLGLARAAKKRGLAVKPVKKGPDYIDAVWLGLAADAPPTNLDTFLMPPTLAAPLFSHAAAGFDLAVIEGNRGLYDGMDEEGSCATSELARLLSAPVILVMDCTKMTRTAAAIVAGMAAFEPGVILAGVVFNRTAGERHRSILRRSVEKYTDVPVLGALPKLGADPIPERHMGLVSHREHHGLEEILNGLAATLEDCCDVPAMLAAARTAPDLDVTASLPWPDMPSETVARIGYVRDAALWFYYEENLEALRRAGAELVELTLLDDAPWPEIHGLYLGGGFPETMAAELASHQRVMERVRGLAARGLPIYAECGGFMYLARSVSWDGRSWPMAGVLPVSVEVCERPRGLGYVRAKTVGETMFHPQGAEIAGHEFHYSHCVGQDLGKTMLTFELSKGQGMTGVLDGRPGGLDGMVQGSVFASYTHIHALGAPWWADNFVSAAKAWKNTG